MNKIEKIIFEETSFALLYFYTEHCQPCKKLKPIMENIKKNLSDVAIIRLNATSEELLVKKYNIMSVPTLILINKEKEISRLNGFYPEDKIRQWIEENIS